MRVVVVGVGAVGARAARQLASTTGVDEIALADVDDERCRSVAASVGDMAEVVDPDRAPWGADVAVLALPARAHGPLAAELLRHGLSIVSTSDDIETVRDLLDLDPEARERGRNVVIGAAFSPGLSCVLARHAAAGFDQVDEIHVAKAGTGGPACARQRHRALGDRSVDWRDGGWVERRGGSGRELAWFPDPIGAEDCYRAALPDPLLLVAAFPGVHRVTARLSANRRDRITAWLPMLRRPHPEGGLGAVRVEVRGQRGTARDTHVLGAIDRPGVAGGVVAAVAAAAAAEHRFRRRGAAGLAELAEPVPFLTELARRGVRAAVFSGDTPALTG